MRKRIRELLSITMILFSLFLFANLTIDSNFFDASSEKVLDLENDAEQEDDAEEKEFILSSTFSLYALFTCNQKQTQHTHSLSYHNNASLFKPPIFS